MYACAKALLLSRPAALLKIMLQKVGGGIYSGTYTMTGGVIKDNNNSLTEAARLSTLGDGVFVGTAFNLGNNAEISTNNDVYLTAGDSIPKEGRYINVISQYTGASTAKTDSDPQRGSHGREYRNRYAACSLYDGRRR